MKLRKEDVDVTSEDSTEYRTAIKSVIRCQIQSLLQKLALETGEESIVISMNLSAGTYTHLGSYLGQEWLDDRNDLVQTLSACFSEYCAKLQNHAQSFSNTQLVGQEEKLSRDVFPAESPTNSAQIPILSSRQHSRKRPLTPSSKTSPPNKRKASHFSASQDQSRLVQLSSINSSDVLVYQSATGLLTTSPSGKGNTNSSNSYVQQAVEGQSTSLDLGASGLPHGWIKAEPNDDYADSNGGNDLSDNTFGRNTDSLSTTDQTSPQQSIINRPQSLIPLANISKKLSASHSHSKPVKQEVSDISSDDRQSQALEESLPTQSSILRSLYEQPIYGMLDSPLSTNDRSESPSQLGLALPDTLQENLDSSPSENLVLSGYYDPDNYPRYRHSKKHPAKKSKQAVKEKTNATVSLGDSSPMVGLTKEEPRMKTFESGGRLVYACDVCKRELSHLTSYRRHMKLHTMERPHKCPVCGKGFIRKYHCIDHLNKHHKDVEFDAESLALTGQSRSLYSSPVPTNDQALSDTYSISPSEYNYTLDQSIEGSSDLEQSMNVSIDQSASTMLSELAKSAAREKGQLEDPTIVEKSTETYKQKVASYINTVDASHVAKTTEEEDDQEGDEYDNDGQENEGGNGKKLLGTENESRKNGNGLPAGMTDENGTDPTNNSQQALDDALATDTMTTMKGESPAMARKQEVSEGIKAIVAHLKSSSRRKRQLVDSMENSKQVLEES